MKELKLKSEKHLEKYQGLIRKWASIYTKNNLGSFEDMLQEAYMVYIDACNKYNPDKAKFSTFLTVLLRNHLYYMKRQKQKELDTLSLDVQLPDAHEPFISLIENHHFVLEGEFINELYKGKAISQISREKGISRRKVKDKIEEERKNHKPYEFIK